MTRARAKLALLCASPLLSLLLVEFAVRVKDRWDGHPYSAAATEKEWRDIVTAVNANLQQQATGVAAPPKEGDVSLHPYVGFEWNYVRDQIRRETAYFASDESKKTFDVLIVGSSVAAGFAKNATGRFIELLHEDPRLAGRPIRVLPHGVGGYKEPQQALLVLYLLGLGYEPEVILNIDGFNECTLSIENARFDCHPDFPSVDHWAHLLTGLSSGRDVTDRVLAIRGYQLDAQRVLDRALTYQLAYSAWLGPHVTTRLEHIQADYVDAQQAYTLFLRKNQGTSLLGPPFEGDAQRALDIGLRDWLECSRSIAGLCRARSIQYLHVLQPTLHDQGSKPLTADEIEHGTLLSQWIDAVHLGYPRLRELGAKLRAEGIDFLDGSRVFEHETGSLYVDGCHFAVEGHELFARAITRELLTHLPAELDGPGFQPLESTAEAR